SLEARPSGTEAEGAGGRPPQEGTARSPGGPDDRPPGHGYGPGGSSLEARPSGTEAEGAGGRPPQEGTARSPGVPDRRGGPTVLEGDEARVPTVLRELDGAALAHIAAHGTFRADSPLFSSLRMADGPLIVHDFERLDRSPYRIILPCCDTARFASVGADELLGLVTALLPLGTAGVVACTAPVSDAAVVPLMLALHKGLDAGLSLAEALRDARASLPGDAVHQATGWAFTAFGAA
ncbi:CHAT domain-containing protein, partial [Streptomyces coelicoflavus]|uniref:CHAT domain-containing protein n=1 Tax=Streptomyces coelicoflavus TaxID=285562 RepID=UPI003A882CD5